MPRIQGTLNIKNKILAFRQKAGITQQELADAVEVTRATILSIEKGSYNPSLELAFRISRFFGTKIENLFTIEEEK